MDNNNGATKEIFLDFFLFILKNEPVEFELLEKNFAVSGKTIGRNLSILKSKDFITLEKESYKSKPSVKVNWNKFDFLKDKY